MIEHFTPSSHYCRLRAEPNYTRELAPGISFRKFAHRFIAKEHRMLANVYTLTVSLNAGHQFAMRFSDRGDYALNLAKKAYNTCPSIDGYAAMNCNFGFVTTSEATMPAFTGYNLCIENGAIKQLPVADKTACVIGKDGIPRLKFLEASGTLEINGCWLKWRGSMSKAEVQPKCDVEIFNAFNVPLVQVDHKLTGKAKVIDPARAYPEPRVGHVFVEVEFRNGRLLVKAVPTDRPTSFLRSRLICRVEAKIAPLFSPGAAVRVKTVGDVDVTTIQYASSVGAILTPDSSATEMNIERSQIRQTTTRDGAAVYSGSARYARACLVEMDDQIGLMLVDARSKVPCHAGVTVDELRELIQRCFPRFVHASNVDGGHACKLIVRRDRRFHIYGNLHYQLWPRCAKGQFSWDGTRGRKLPGIIYCIPRI